MVDNNSGVPQTPQGGNEHVPPPLPHSSGPPSLHKAGMPSAAPQNLPPSHGEQVVVPNVVGLFNTEAFHTLTVSNLRTAFFHENTSKESPENSSTMSDATTGQELDGTVEFVSTEQAVPAGTVIGQNPKAGVTVPARTAVTLQSNYEKKSNKGLIIGIVAAVVIVLVGGLLAFTMINGNKVSVPDLAKTSLSQATNTLETQGLKVGSVTKQKQKGASNIVLSQDPKSGESVKKGTVVNLVVSETATGLVPNVVGSQLQAAESEMKESGFVLGVVTKKDSPQAAGTVLSQSPLADKTANLGAPIDLVVSSGSNIVPSVVGMTVEKASNTLVGQGLVVNVVYTNTTQSPAGTVISQNPAGGSSAPDGTTITINVAKTPPTPTPVPTPTATVTITPTPTVVPTPTTVVTVTP